LLPPLLYRIPSSSPPTTSCTYTGGSPTRLSALATRLRSPPSPQRLCGTCRSPPAPPGALRHPSPGKARQLEAASEKFNTFINELEQNHQQRAARDAARGRAMAESLAKLESAMAAESKRRGDADEQLQAVADEGCKGLREQAAAAHGELQGGARASLEGLDRTVADLQAVVK
jgi:hypothetical protein